MRAVGIGFQQSQVGIIGRHSGQRIKGGQFPRRDAGHHIDTRRHPHDDAEVIHEIEVAVERAAALGNMNAHIAQANFTEVEGSQVQIAVQLLHDADGLDNVVRIGGILKPDGVRQPGVDGDEAIGARAFRPGDAHAVIARGRPAKVTAPVGRRYIEDDGLLLDPDVDAEAGGVGRLLQLQVQGRGIRRRPAGLGGVMAIPLADLVEESGKVAGGDDFIAGAAAEKPGADHLHQADKFGRLTKGRRFIFRPQQAGFGERRQVGLAPGRRIGGGHLQRRGRLRVGQDAIAHQPGLRKLVIDVILGRHRRGGGDHVEVEGQLLLVQLGQVFFEPLGILFEQFSQFGIDIHREGQSCVATVDEVVGESRRHQLAVQVDHGIDLSPRHVRQIGSAVEIGAENHRWTGDQIRSWIGHIGHAENDVNVRRVDVGQAVNAEPVPTDVSQGEFGGSPNGHGQVQRLGRFHQIPVRQHRHRAIRIDHLDVVQPMRRVLEIEHGDDLGRADDLVIHRLELGELRPDQLHHGVIAEFCARDRHGDAAIAADVRSRVIDAERQRSGQEGDGRVGLRLAMAADHDVVGALFGGGHAHSLIGPEVAFENRVVVDGVGQAFVTDIDLVGGALVAAGKLDLERLARRGFHAIEQFLGLRQGVVLRDAQVEPLHGHVQALRRGGGVVPVVGAFVNVVKDVGADDDAVLARHGGRHAGAQFGRVTVARLQSLRFFERALLDAADQFVAEVPQGVAGKIDGVGPDTGDGFGRMMVGHLPFDGEGVARNHGHRHDDFIGLQVGRRRQLDDHRPVTGRGVVGFAGRLIHFSLRCGAARHIRQHEHIIIAQQPARNGQRQGHRITLAHPERALVRDGHQEMIAADVQIFVARQVNLVGPLVLPVRHRDAAGVGHLVRQIEAAAGDGVSRRDDAGDAQVGGLGQLDGQGLGRDVVGFVTEFMDPGHAGRIVGFQPRIAVETWIRHDAASARNRPRLFIRRVGEDEQVEIPLDGIGQTHGAARGVAGPRFQHSVVPERAQQLVIDIERSVHRDIDAVQPAADARRATARVGHGPGHRQEHAGFNIGREREESGHAQIRLAISHRQHSGIVIVGLLASLPHPAQVILRPVRIGLRARFVKLAAAGFELGIAITEDVEVFLSFDAFG